MGKASTVNREGRCRLRSISGEELEELLVPATVKETVFDILYPFKPIPLQSEMMADVNTGNRFMVSEFRVFIHNGKPLLTTPWYPEDGGTVLDWVPAEIAANGGIYIDEIQPQHTGAISSLISDYCTE